MPDGPLLLEELRWRGLLYQHTERLPDALSEGVVSAYCGFDPTSDSLHVGSLIPIMGLVHLQKTGHTPVVLLGGGTALIGDPSGKGSERPLMSRGDVERNSAAIREQISRFLEADQRPSARFLDNAEWLLALKAVEFMRDVGKHFTVNYMVAKDSVKGRFDSGISYTEFSYMLLQAYDFLELYRRERVTLQIGGSDQWGNITAGLELIRRVEGGDAHGLTMPLIESASGVKFGKTEAGTVWLDARKTSPYQFYQFWINTDDRDAGRYLRMFTLLSREEIESLDRELQERSQERAAQRALADEVTARVHGADAARTARAVSGVLFGGRDVAALSATELDALGQEIPAVVVPRSDAGSLADLLVAAGLAPSKGRARTLLEQGGAYVNGQRVGPETAVADLALLPGNRLLLRKGARDWALVRLSG